MFQYGIPYFSPSKINLFLKIEGKRNDGFHNLFSCFQALDFGDTIFFKESSGDKFICNEKILPLDNGNLIIKALNLFREYTKISTSFHITLNKKIFLSSGLGGGSSNAATTLFALNQLTKANLSYKELSMLGAQIGADVAFFFSNGLALCKEKGEKVEELDSSYFCHLKKFLLIPFKEFCSTKLIYEKFSFLNCKSNCHFSREELLTSLSSKRPIFFNALEIPAFTLFPKLQEVKKDLKSFFSQKDIFMSGSGGTLVVWIKSTNEKFLNKFLEKYPNSILTKSIFRSNKDNWFHL